MTRYSHISWSYDRPVSVFTGAQATGGEKLLAYCAAVIAPAALALLVWRDLHPAWASWQWAIAIILAADIVGGVVSNATNAQKRLFFSPPAAGDSALIRLLKRQPLLFPAVHLQPFILIPAFGASATYAAGWYLAALVGSAAVHACPVHQRRPLAYALTSLAVLVEIYLDAAPAGMEWFALLFFIKLVVCHAVPEEPYARVESVRLTARK
jgi:hypothetical protein